MIRAIPYSRLALLFTLTCGLWGIDASADILVRFPNGTGLNAMSQTVKAVERTVGIPALGVLAVTAPEGATPSLPRGADALIESAQAAYRRLELDAVTKMLDDAEDVCLGEAAYHACRGFLFEINMIRGMGLMASAGQETAAADQAFRSAHIAEPTRILDPRKYPPNVIRAFANAWSLSEATPKVACRVVSTPRNARVFVDGQPAAGAAVPLAPGRHVIEARVLGYETAYRVVEAAAEREGPLTVSLDLTPEPDAVAWNTLTREVSNPSWQGGNPEVAALLKRFRVEYVLLLTHPAGDAPGFDAAVASAARMGVRPLPTFEKIEGSVPEPFARALMDALGIESVTAPDSAPRDAATRTLDGPSTSDDEGGIDGDEDGDEDSLDEDEDPSIRFNQIGEENGDSEPQFARVLKSPWLWISVGIVAAIVTGVVVSTQVED